MLFFPYIDPCSSIPFNNASRRFINWPLQSGTIPQGAEPVNLVTDFTPEVKTQTSKIKPGISLTAEKQRQTLQRSDAV